jgi:uncharacterized membrane-anchored protein YjiN (DUF445 family)
MYIRQTRDKGRGFGSFLRKVARKGLKTLKSPAVKNIVKKALNNPTVQAAVQFGATKVIDTIANSNAAQSILSNPTVGAIVNNPLVQDLAREVVSSKPIQKAIQKIDPLVTYEPIQKALKKKRILGDINKILDTPKKKKRKGWRKVTGHGITLD